MQSQDEVITYTDIYMKVIPWGKKKTLTFFLNKKRKFTKPSLLLLS